MTSKPVWWVRKGLGVRSCGFSVDMTGHVQPWTSLEPLSCVLILERENEEVELWDLQVPMKP